MNHLRLIPCVLALAGLSGCIFHVDASGDWDGDHAFRVHRVHRSYGSGVTASETREVEVFDRISVEGGRMRVHVAVGTPQSLHVQGDDDLLAHLVTRVEDGVLVLDIDSRYEPARDFEIRVGTQELRAIDLAGAADVDVEGLRGESLDVLLSGSGNVDVEGSTRLLAVQLSGAGNVDLGRLHAVEAQVRISGSGNVIVDVSDKLDVHVSGSGNVEYSGSPVLEHRISGSGTVSSR